MEVVRADEGARLAFHPCLEDHLAVDEADGEILGEPKRKHCVELFLSQ
jgi:hypothetical protein